MISRWLTLMPALGVFSILSAASAILATSSAALAEIVINEMSSTQTGRLSKEKALDISPVQDRGLGWSHYTYQQKKPSGETDKR